MSWYQSGAEAEKKVDVEDAAKKARKAEMDEKRKNAIYRFWMKSDTRQHITFLDDVTSPFGYNTPFIFQEHNVQLNGRWNNFFTCIEGIPHPETGVKQTCPLCKEGLQPQLVAAYTVIDHNEWTDKKSKVHVDEPKLFVCKTPVQKTLRHAAAKRGGLRGWKVEASRGDGNSAATGSEFDFEVQSDAFADVALKDYREVFKPKTAEELQKILGGVQEEATTGDADRVRF